jgi:protein-S-isoprenylcysteine O-methyltransferase Ste14
MEKIGAFIFRNRSYMPIPVLLVGIFWPAYNVSSMGLNMTLGIIFVVLGELGRIWCVSYAGGITRTRKGDLNQLITSGPFSFVRNPIYISNIIMYSASAFLLGVPVLVPFAIIYFTLEYTFIIAYEELLLIKTFGDEYIQYTDNVRRWLPRLTPYVGRNVHYPLVKEALKAERSTFNSIMGIVAVAIIKYFLLR